MPEVKKNCGHGGAGIDKLGDYLRAIIADIDGVTSADIAAPAATNLAEVITLANEMRLALKAVAAYTKTLTEES